MTHHILTAQDERPDVGNNQTSFKKRSEATKMLAYYSRFNSLMRADLPLKITGIPIKEERASAAKYYSDLERDLPQRAARIFNPSF